MALNDYVGPKFHLHECPFIPKNYLRPRKKFLDEHVLKYYNINFMDRIFNNNIKKSNEIITNEKNTLKVQNIKNENDMHTYFYKNKNKGEINTKSKARHFLSRTHESEINSIHHGRGKEKTVSPRKSISDLIRRGIRRDEKHFVPNDKDVLATDDNVSTMSKKCMNSFSKSNIFQKKHEKEFTICSRTTMTSDIPEQEQCEHQPKLDDFNDCKHHSRSLLFLDHNSSTKNHTNLVSCDIEKEIKTQQDVILPKDTEEMKKLFCEKRNTKSRINDLYEEDEYLYDPESRQVSHIVVVKSRYRNFLEYFKTTDTSNEQTPMLFKEIEILASKYLKSITLCQPSDQSELLLPEQQNVRKTILPLESNNNLKNSTSPDMSFKELIENDPIKSQYAIVEKCLQDELQEFHMNESFERTKLATLQCIHKRPELQKRFFYNEFKTYKRKYSQDDIFHSNEVKLTREKFEKILSKLINRNKLHSALDNDREDILKTQLQESSISLKKNHTSASEDNIHLRKSEENEYVLNKSSNNVNEPIYKKNGTRTLQSSFMKVKFSPRKEDSKKKQPNLKNQVPKLHDKTASMDSILIIESNDLLTEGGKCKPQRAKSLSVDSSHGDFQKIKYFPGKHKNIGMLRIHDDENLHSIFNVTQNNHYSRTYAQKSMKAPNQSEMIINIQKKVDLGHRTNEHCKENKNSPHIKVVIKEGKPKYPEDNYYNQAVIDEIYHHNSDDLESFGRPVSEEVLIKIRECGTSVTYFGGRIIRKEYGPMCSPMTMTILNEIKEYMSVLNDHFHKITDGEKKI